VLERCGHIRILTKQTALEEIDLRRVAQHATRKMPRSSATPPQRPTSRQLLGRSSRWLGPLL
jgi:hypothetical protein